MTESDQDRRVANRNEVSLPAVVKGRENKSKYWKEQTEIVTVSRLGASFVVGREWRVGRILSLITNMPKSLRCYDVDKKLYRVWGLIQHCSPVYGEESKFHIGIAFIGKHAPQSYAEDPLKSYRIVGMDEDGFWNIGESKTPFISRAHHRFPCCLEVVLTAIDSDGNLKGESVDAMTDNVSYGGALVFSTLDVNSGDAVRFTCKKYDYSSVAVVRNRQEREGNRTTLHLQFMESNFPIKEIEMPYQDDPEIDGTDELRIIEADEALAGLQADSTADDVSEGSPILETSSGEAKTFVDEDPDDEELSEESDEDTGLELDAVDSSGIAEDQNDEFSLDIDSDAEPEDSDEPDDDASLETERETESNSVDEHENPVESDVGEQDGEEE